MNLDSSSSTQGQNSQLGKTLRTVDLNLDAGEYPSKASATDIQNEELLFKNVTSVNIACGGHAGDVTSMTRAVRLAKSLGLAVGAHPSYPDPKNFGRAEMKLEPLQLKNSIVEQLHALLDVCDGEGVVLNHVKPHGALYHVCCRDEITAHLFANSVRHAFSTRKPRGGINPFPQLVGLAGSYALYTWRNEGFRVVAEGFVDRLYSIDGTLVPRGEPGAVFGEGDIERIVDQALALAQGEPFLGQGRSLVRVPVQTLCIHGDRADAVAVAQRVRRELDRVGVTVRALEG